MFSVGSVHIDSALFLCYIAWSIMDKIYGGYLNVETKICDKY